MTSYSLVSRVRYQISQQKGYPGVTFGVIQRNWRRLSLIKIPGEYGVVAKLNYHRYVKESGRNCKAAAGQRGVGDAPANVFVESFR